MPVLLANNAVGRLSGAVTPTAEQIPLAAGDGARFPAPAADEWYPLTLINPAGQLEIVRVVERVSDVLTVERAQEGTSALSFSPGDRAELRITTGALLQMLEDAKLPYAAVQQGGGAGQGDAKVFIGWSGTALKAQAGSLDYGTLWSSYNFDPASRMPVAGGEFTGKISTATTNAAMAQGDASASIEVRNAAGSGDGGLAMIGFHCLGTYAAKLGLRSDGYFGFGGWSRAAWQFYSAANGDFIAAGNVGAYSDPRLKEDIKLIADPWRIIDAIDGVRFTWSSKSTLVGRPGQRDVGVLADQVEAVLPEIVGRSIPDDENGGEQWRVVAYDKLTPVIIEAVKDINRRLKALEAD